MPQVEQNAYVALVNYLPKLIDELRKMNALKALELKLKFHGMVEPIPEWVSEIDDIIKH